MSTYAATVEWARDGGDFLAGRYSRAHTIRFDGVSVPGSSSAANVPLPWSVDAAVDPEEMIVASLSTCHMLWFLDLARRDGLAVESYRDAASGVLDEDERGRLVMTRVVLRPEVRFSASEPSAERLDALHHRAHEACFIANSVRTEVQVEPVWTKQEERQDG